MRSTLLCSFFFISLCHFSHAQWTQGTQKLTTNDSVGVNMSNPLYSLDVSGTIRTNYFLRMTGGRSSFLTNLGEIGIYRSKDAGTAYPFDNNGHLVLQSRSSTGNARDIVFVTGSTPTANMILASNGKLGLGITNPAAMLDVRSSNSLDGKYSNANALLRVGDGTTDLVMDGNEIYSNQGLVLGAAYSGSIVFRNVDSNGNQELMRLDPDGKLGIGTNNPSAKLDVEGNAKINGDITLGDNSGINLHGTNSDMAINYNITDGSHTVINRFQNNTANIMDMTVYPGAALPFIQFRNSSVPLEDFRIYQNGSIAATGNADIQGDLIVHQGKVGIGTSTPLAGLHVNHDDGIKISSAFSTSSRSSIRMVDDITEGSAARDDLLIETAGAILFRLDNNENGISGSHKGFAVLDGSDNTVLVAEELGNVGIGTNSPSAKLDLVGSAEINGTLNGKGEYVSYRNDYGTILRTKNTTATGSPDQLTLSHNLGDVEIQNLRGTIDFKSAVNMDDRLTVDNDIIAKKLRVTVNPSLVPDYVFQPGYNLKTLAEVEAYIKANSHLPGIASASEIGANGQDVGTMQLSLLEKVEELTLYAIDSDKKLTTVDTENKELKAENKVLKDTLAELLKRVEKLENKGKTSNDQ